MSGVWVTDSLDNIDSLYQGPGATHPALCHFLSEPPSILTLSCPSATPLLLYNFAYGSSQNPPDFNKWKGWYLR